MVEILGPESTGVIVAADVDSDRLSALAKASANEPGILGYKLGLVSGLDLSLRKATDRIRRYTDAPIIYDHQKAGNDIPKMGSKFADVCRRGGVDAVILFPFSSPVTERDWIHAAQDAGLQVLVGGHMTHEQFLESEGGFIADSAPERIYRIGAENGVRNFVVPGNKVEYVARYRDLLREILGEEKFALWAPGFITQKGEISKFALEAGPTWRAIVGSAIYGQENEVRSIAQMRAATRMVTAQIR